MADRTVRQVVGGDRLDPGVQVASRCGDQLGAHLTVTAKANQPTLFAQLKALP